MAVGVLAGGTTAALGTDGTGSIGGAGGVLSGGSGITVGGVGTLPTGVPVGSGLAMMGVSEVGSGAGVGVGGVAGTGVGTGVATGFWASDIEVSFSCGTSTGVSVT